MSAVLVVGWSEVASVSAAAVGVAGHSMLAVPSGAAAGLLAVVAVRVRLGLGPRRVAEAAVENLVVASVAAVGSAVVAAADC